jgi:hypothetical protein
LARHHGYAAQLVVGTPENAARSLQASLRVPALELSPAIGDFKRLGRVESELQLTEEYKAQLNPPAASVTTRLHNAFAAGYHNATASLLGLILWLEEYGPAFLIWFLIVILPAIFLWRRYQKKAATV